MDTKIYFADIVILKNPIIPIVWSVMRGAVVKRYSRGESQTGLKTILIDQFSTGVL